MKRLLPDLSRRDTRVRLLAWTLEDALLGGAMDGRPDEYGSRLNLHPQLWTQGSYRELVHALEAAPRDARRHVTRQYVAVTLHNQPKTISPELTAVVAAMPANIYVPVDISCAAGYLEGAARTYAMPKAEQARRHARVPDRRRGAQPAARLASTAPKAVPSDPSATIPPCGRSAP